MASKCNFPTFSFTFSFPALPAFALPTIPVISFVINIPCPLD